MATGSVNRPSAIFYKLWENSDPTATFTSKTVTLDLSEFGAVLIIFAGSTTYSNRTLSQIVLKNGHNHLMASMLTGGTVVRCRMASANDNGVTFDGGYQGTSANNTAVIPLEIYGIKGVPV